MSYEDNQPYDPTAPEGDAGGNQYLSKKDLRILVVVLVLLGFALYPMYLYGLRSRDKSLCTQNMKAIFDALHLYAVDHDDGLPPVYRTGNGDMPGLGASGKPYTWASDIAPYMNVRSSFVCPAADPSENVHAEDQKTLKGDVPMSYGMYAPYGGFKTFNIENPEQTVIVAETSNDGAQTSYDPLPFDKGRQVPDGFLIGWDNSNDQASSASRFVTRLAFRETSNGLFGSKAYGRHDNGIHALTASGERLNLKPDNAVIVQQDRLPGGFWRVPALRRARR